MANIDRGSLVVKSDTPRHQPIIANGSSLLATTLAIAGLIPLPLGSDNSFPAQQIVRAPGNHLNANTSCGSAPTLLAPTVAAPLFNAPQAYETRKLPAAAQPQGADPKLFPATLQISVGRPFLSVQLARSLLETSQSTPLMITSVVPAVPLVSAPQSYELRNRPIAAALPQSTDPKLYQTTPEISKGVPFLTVKQTPWLLPDTSKGTSNSLLSAVPAPLFNTPQSYAARGVEVFAQSQSIDPKLYPAPLEISKGVPFLQVQLPRIVSETSQGTSASLRGVVAPPLFNAPQPYTIRGAEVFSQQQGTNPAILPAPAPIIYGVSFYTVRLQSVLSETSQGTPATLRTVVAAPVFNVAPQFAAQRFTDGALQQQTRSPTLLPAALEIGAGRPFLGVQLVRGLLETSQSSPLAITTPIAPIFNAPQSYELRRQPTAASSQSTSSQLFPATPTAFTLGNSEVWLVDPRPRNMVVDARPRDWLITDH